MSEDAGSLKTEILEMVRRYFQAAHHRPAFNPGKTRIQYSSRVYDEREMVNLVDAALDFWLTAGPYADKFENGMRRFFGSRDFVLVNAGSSANLLMVATICSRELKSYLKDEDPLPLVPGDEVITPAVTFPTTLAPIVQNGLVPVFVDCPPGTYNVDPALVEGAIGPRTRAIFVPHTLGLLCEIDVIKSISEKHRLWLLEDGCDALGATFNGQLAGTFGAMSSLSFYPAHQMTMGEGGGVVINHPRLRKTVRSIRDWGRDCWCDSGVSNTCGKRFEWQLGELPHGYDHKYIYSNIGYNLKATDLQAAIGLAQLDKIPALIERRRHNFHRIVDGLRPLQEFLLLPQFDPRTNPSPFGFPITVQPGTDRAKLIRWLEERNVETRLVFGGNILRQPGYVDIQRRVHGTLTGSDRIMRDTFFVGVYPGLTDEMIDYVIEQFWSFFQKSRPVNSGVPSPVSVDEQT